jgi:hypothetical protein
MKKVHRYIIGAYCNFSRVPFTDFNEQIAILQRIATNIKFYSVVPKTLAPLAQRCPDPSRAA